MKTITIEFRDGSTQQFQHQPRPGGSWEVSVTCKDGFVVVTDEWGKRTSFPADTVKCIKEIPRPHF